jgi:hypothetical protein
MKKGILILLLLVSNQVFSQLTSPSSRILINKDTLTCLKDTEIKIINKMAASERFYHSMYNNHIGKIANLEKQLSTLDMIANDYKTSYEAKLKQYETLDVQYQLTKDDYDELENSYWIVEAKRNTWKALTIAGIPISFVGGVLLTVKLLN